MLHTDVRGGLELELDYWRSRATTAEEKVKEWSIRACEAEQRIANAREILERYPRIVKEALDALEGK